MYTQGVRLPGTDAPAGFYGTVPAEQMVEVCNRLVNGTIDFPTRVTTSFGSTNTYNFKVWKTLFPLFLSGNVFSMALTD